jgi:hypothetical protein
VLCDIIRTARAVIAGHIRRIRFEQGLVACENILDRRMPKAVNGLSVMSASKVFDMVIAGHRQTLRRVRRVAKLALDLSQFFSVNLFEERSTRDLDSILDQVAKPAWLVNVVFVPPKAVAKVFVSAGS